MNKAVELWKSFWAAAAGGRNAAYLVRYIVVGLVNTAFYTVLLFLFLNKTKFVHPLSVSLAFVLSMIFQYLANKFFTFRSQALSGSEVLRYAVVALGNYLLSVAIVWIVLDLAHSSKLIASGLSSCIVAGTGFILSRFWIYRPAEKDAK